MVTTTHKNISKRYLNIKDWIEDGITNDALWVSLGQWSNKAGRDYDVNVVRNHIGLEFMGTKQLNKW